MATCAACRQAILPGATFALAGTEVFHRACVSRIAQSVGTRQRLEIVRLQHALTQAQRDVDQRDRDLAAKRDHAAREALAASDQIAAQHRRLVRAERERDEARRDQATARDELALLQALAGAREALGRTVPAPAPATHNAATPGPAPPEPDRGDDAEQRFRLLELDPLR